MFCFIFFLLLQRGYHFFFIMEIPSRLLCSGLQDAPNPPSNSLPEPRPSWMMLGVETIEFTILQPANIEELLINSIHRHFENRIRLKGWGQRKKA